MHEQEKDLFQGYEIKHWDYSPYLYKIFAGAAIFNLLLIAVLAQTNVLTARGCESPFVGRVCQVLDTVYVGSSILGTDSEFVSKDYDKTLIEDADITYIDVSGVTPPLNYPDGYFALANPNDFQAMGDPTMGFMNASPNADTSNIGGIPGIPGISSNPTIFNNPGNLMNTPQVVPTPNSNAISGNIPTSPFTMSDVNPNPNPTTPPPVVSRKVPRGTVRNPVQNRRNVVKSPSKLPKLDGEETTVAENKEPKETEKKEPKKDAATSLMEDDGKLNKRPLEDFGVKYGEQILNKQINVNAPFTIEIIAGLDKNGKFVNPKSVAQPGSDEKMTEVAKEAIAAFSDTKLLKPLYDVGGRNVKIIFAQNQDNLQAIIQAETKSDSMAKTMQSLLNLFLKNVTLKEGSDEEILLKKAQFATQGKNFIINFLIENEQKTQMIEKSLRGLQEKQKKNQLNNGNNVGGIPNDNAR